MIMIITNPETNLSKAIDMHEKSLHDLQAIYVFYSDLDWDINYVAADEVW